MRLGGGVALEAVFVPTLLLAHLAVPSQFLQPLRLHLVRQVLWRPLLGLRHLAELSLYGLADQNHSLESIK